jgi:hypothetical protein
MRDPLVAKNVPAICHMLIQTPDDANKDAIKIWKRMRRLSVDIFERYWAKVESEASLLN